MLSKSSGQIFSSHIGSKKCFLFLSDYESMSLRHLQDVCENLGVLNRKFTCWCHTKKYNRDLKSRSKSAFFDWLTGSIEFAIKCYKMELRLAKCKSDLKLCHFGVANQRVYNKHIPESFRHDFAVHCVLVFNIT